MDLYDIPFDTEKKVAQKNPMPCLGCHSASLPEFSVGGAKMILQDAPWPSFVGTTMEPPFGNLQRTAYFKKIQDTAIDAIQNQPRYSCIKKYNNEETKGISSGTLATLDGLVLEANQRRTFKIMQSSQDYKKFRPLIVGALLRCLTDVPWPVRSDLEKFNKEFPNWMPPEVATKIFKNVDFIQQEYRSTTAFRKAQLKFYETEFAEEKKSRIVRDSIQREEQNPFEKTAYFYPGRNFDALGSDELEKTKKEFLGGPSLEPFADTVSDLSPVTQLYGRYALDTNLRSEMGHMPPPLVRFLFEARGISTITWSKDLAGGYGTTNLLTASYLRRLETNDPFWSDIASLVEQLDKNVPALTGTDLSKERSALCKILAQRSMDNFSRDLASEKSKGKN